MAAGVSDTLYDTEWIVGLIDANAPAPKKRGKYKPRKKDNSNWDTTQDRLILIIFLKVRYKKYPLPKYR